MNGSVYEYIDKNVESFIKPLEKLISVASVKSAACDGAPYGKKCREALDVAKEICEADGYSCRIIGDRMLEADWGESEETPETGILCHLDVVPAGEGWDSDPYKLTVRDGKMFGRGTSDDKGPAAAVLAAISSLRACGYTPKRSLRILFGSDEERGSSDLAYYREVKKLPKRVFTPDAEYPVINIEKGLSGFSYKADYLPEGRGCSYIRAGISGNAVPQKAEARFFGYDRSEIKKAFSGCDIKEENGEFGITVSGRSAHASKPDGGDNALTKLISKAALLPGAETEIFRGLARLFPHNVNDGSGLSIDASDEKSGALTCVLSICDLKDGKLSLYFDIRYPCCVRFASLSREIEYAMGTAGFVKAGENGLDPHETDAGDPFVKTLLAAYTEVTGEKAYPVAIGGGTYVHTVEGGVAFGAEFPWEDPNMHGVNEYMSLKAFTLNVKIFAAAIYSLCCE